MDWVSRSMTNFKVLGMRTKTIDERKPSIEKLDLNARESVYAEKTFDNKPCKSTLRTC